MDESGASNLTHSSLIYSTHQLNSSTHSLTFAVQRLPVRVSGEHASVEHQPIGEQEAALQGDALQVIVREWFLVGRVGRKVGSGITRTT